MGEAILGWVAMIAPAPNGAMPPVLLVCSTTLTVAAALAIAAACVRRTRSPAAPGSDLAVLALISFSAVVFLELTVIVYVLQKDVFRYARYHFVYFPAVMVLLGGILARAPIAAALVLLSATIGSAVYAYGYGPQDAFNSRRIASAVTAAGVPTVTVMGGDSFLATSIGLSIAREIDAFARERPQAASFSYVPWDAAAPVWPGTVIADREPAELWLVHPPGADGFPDRVALVSGSTRATRTCARSPDPVHEAGLRYARYRCVRAPAVDSRWPSAPLSSPAPKRSASIASWRS
jgi:hypothetical protein